MEKEDIFNAYNLFQVPELDLETKGKKNKFVIGVIDASGSMGSYWKAMVKFWNERVAPQTNTLITFSHVAKVEKSTFLSENLKEHGGGMTHILSAFQKVEEELIKLDEKASITIIFISDGEDTINGSEKLIK